MSSTLIKNVIEEKVKISEDQYENRVQITFDTSDFANSNGNTITLTGQGSVKVLMPV